jgi:DNA mismatch endonuclease (patch repair protein)
MLSDTLLCGGDERAIALFRQFRSECDTHRRNRVLMHSRANKRTSSPPKPSSDAAAKRMRSTKQRDNDSEKALRSALHRLGYRFRIHREIVPGTRRSVDIVFPTDRVAVFVDGCFWHACPEHGTLPKSNRDWWVQKLTDNAKRDRDTDKRLLDANWLVIRIWEHDDPGDAAARIANSVESRRSERRQRSS